MAKSKIRTVQTVPYSERAADAYKHCIRNLEDQGWPEAEDISVEAFPFLKEIQDLAPGWPDEAIKNFLEDYRIIRHASKDASNSIRRPNKFMGYIIQPYLTFGDVHFEYDRVVRESLSGTWKHLDPWNVDMWQLSHTEIVMFPGVIYRRVGPEKSHMRAIASGDGEKKGFLGTSGGKSK